MIEIENIAVGDMKAALRGMRNPMNSWDRSDSVIRCANYNEFDCSPDCDGCCRLCEKKEERPEHDGFSYTDEMECWAPGEIVPGPNDMILARGLAGGGPVHGKYLRMIPVTMDITAPLYWWKEFDTYKVGTVANSCSTMHKIHSRDLTIEDFSFDHLISHKWSEADNFDGDVPMDILEKTIEMLNHCRQLYIGAKHTGDTARATLFWQQMIQLLPSSYNQRRTVMMNYEVIRHIQDDRCNHKLMEWRKFCQIMREELPYFMTMTWGDSLEGLLTMMERLNLDEKEMDLVRKMITIEKDIKQKRAEAAQEIYRKLDMAEKEEMDESICYKE